MNNSITNKQVCIDSVLGNGAHTSVELLSQRCARIKADPASLEEEVAFQEGAFPLEFLCQEGSPLEDPLEASCQEVGPSYQEEVPLGP